MHRQTASIFPGNVSFRGDVESVTDVRCFCSIEIFNLLSSNRFVCNRFRDSFPQNMVGNTVQSRQTLFVRYCRYIYGIAGKSCFLNRFIQHFFYYKRILAKSQSFPCKSQCKYSRIVFATPSSVCDKVIRSAACLQALEAFATATPIPA